MTFAEPLWLWLLVVIPIVVTLSILQWMRRGKAWKKLVAARLEKRLVRPRSGVKVFVALSLAMLGFALLVTSLAMPEAGEEWIETRTESRNLLLCFDISQSMLTEDSGAGSRLDAAKAAALEIAERFPTDRIGLLIFSGETQVTVPLTIDHTFLNQTINQLNPLDLPIGGSNVALALNDATDLLVDTGQRNNVMIVFSDGEDHSSGIEIAARRAKSNGIFVYTLGFGSEKGDFIKDPRERGGFFLDRRGNRVLSQLKEESLQTIARETDGLYAQGVGNRFLGSLDAAVARMDVFQQEGGHQRIAKPVFQWFLLPSLLLLMSSVIVSRLGSAAKSLAVLLACITLPNPVEANELSDSFLGKRANQEGEHGKAHQLFESAAEAAEGARRAKFHLAAGASASQAADWDAAISSFSQALISEESETRHQAHFALANALFYRGAQNEEAREKSWKGAVAHFEESLKIEQTKAAKENLEAVRKLLKQEQQEEEKEQEQEKSEDENNEEENEKNEDPQEGEEGEEGEPEEGEETDDKKEESEGEGESGENENPDEPKEGEQENQGESGENESPEEGENSEDPQEGEPNEENPEEQQTEQAQENQENQEEPKEETAEERARRILNQQADFGDRPPSSRRRVLRRPEKDW